jgi:hypothetical protein
MVKSFIVVFLVMNQVVSRVATNLSKEPAAYILKAEIRKYITSSNSVINCPCHPLFHSLAAVVHQTSNDHHCAQHDRR